MNQENSTILIADDKKENRVLIKAILKNERYRFLEAVNGQEAVSIAKEHLPDLILMDAIMPEMDGFLATKIIRNTEILDKIPIIMITALDSKEDKIKALDAGVNDFISKPIDKEELIVRCRSYINYSKIVKKYILATYDPITNLPNKIALMERLKECKVPKLMLIKIKNYSILEEFYGENIANTIKINMPKYIESLLPEFCKSSELFHINDDEFALLNDDIDNHITPKDCFSNIHMLIENSRRKPLKIGEIEYELVLTASFSCLKEKTFESARMALNHALRENLDIVFANEIAEKLFEEEKKSISMIKEIRQAIHNDRIIAYLQPILNNKSEQIDKYEALVRLKDSKGNILSPFAFLEAAKMSGYYSKITGIMLKLAADAINKLNKEISVNFSASDLENNRIKDFIYKFLKKHKEISNKITFELLEDESYKNIDNVIDFINEIKKRYSIKVSIDDYGSGYSNLERIIRFQPDYLKIDGSIVKNIVRDDFNKKALKSIIDFARNFEMKTVAEFVENDEIYQKVKEMGVDFSQGYFISKPKPLSQIIE